MEHVSTLTPGSALDVGAGEGADAVWLADRGWDVTALDISPVALGRTEQHAVDRGVADRVRTVEHDLVGSPVVPGEYDLVSAQFWHPPPALRTTSYLGLAAAVGPGGVLLVVGHHPDDLGTGARRGHGDPDRLFRPEQVAEVLAPEQWQIKVCDVAPRDAAGPDGPMRVTDSVVLAVRR